MATFDQNGRNGSTDCADVAFRLPVLLAVFIAVGFAGRLVTPLPFLPQGVSLFAGIFVIASSIAIFLWAALTLMKAGKSISNIGRADSIIMDGPFRRSRNPICLSMIYLQIGIGFWVNSLWFVGLAIISAGFLTWGVIQREERYLEKKFGEEYIKYKRRVRRWG